MKGLQILLAPEDYIRAVKARVVAMTKGEVSSPELICGLRCSDGLYDVHFWGAHIKRKVAGTRSIPSNFSW
jgi:hypothetical protein